MLRSTSRSLSLPRHVNIPSDFQDRSSGCSDAFTLEDSDIFAVHTQNKGLHDKCKLLTREGKQFLEEENFSSPDFWEGYKLYCFARYSHCTKSRHRFLSSKMGRVVYLIHKESHGRWGSTFDNRVRQVLAMMEEYAEVCRGQNWRNLRALMEEFDDVKKLSASENGCLLLQLVEDDDYGTERLHRHSQSVDVPYTNIFDELHQRLKRMGSNLDSLMKSSGVSSKAYKKNSGKRCTMVRALERKVEKK